MPRSDWKQSSALTKRIRAILSSRGLTVADVSRLSSLPHSGRRHEHVPHNLYEAIQKRDFSPGLFQLSALAETSGYRLVDWLSVFGIAMDVARLQAVLPALKTSELDTRRYQPDTRIHWFRDIQDPVFSESFVPLSQWIGATSPIRIDRAGSSGNHSFRYLKIGSKDNYAFPDLLPGSIVRFKTGTNVHEQIPLGKIPHDVFFLVEHGKGLICSRLCRPKPNSIVLCSRDLPYAPMELELGTQASVLGVADLEIRPMTRVQPPQVSSDSCQFWTPTPLSPQMPTQHVGTFIRNARKRAGITFRMASQRTRHVAELLDDHRYFCSPGSLSDFEANVFPPRQIRKLISICAVYFASVSEAMKAAGVDLDKAAHVPIPSELMPGNATNSRSEGLTMQSVFMNEMKRRFLELPLFLEDALPSIFELPKLSVRDVFWVGDQVRFFHQFLTGARFLVVDRKRKIPRTSLKATVREQPLYVLQRRNGTCFCGSCSLHDNYIVVRPWIHGMPKIMKLRNRMEIEVVGQVTGVVRQFG
jgi:transcriptional regulator with XRE-family HTH domain